MSASAPPAPPPTGSPADRVAPDESAAASSDESDPLPEEFAEEAAAPIHSSNPPVERPGTGTKGRRRQWIDAAFSLALVGVGIGAMVALQSLKEPVRPINRVTPPPMVEVADVTQHVGGLDVTSDGVVVPYRLVNVGAEVGGRVVSMDPNLRSGRYVTAGQTLLTIDPETYRLEAKRLEAEVRAAVSSLAELTVQIENAKGSTLIARQDAELAAGETARAERLREQRSGSTAAVETARRAELQAKDKLQTAANNLRLLNAQQERLKVQQELSETALERAQLDLQRTEVKSPVSGLIVSSEVEEGGRVQAGGALFTVSDTSQAEVRTNLQMKDVAWILAHPPEGTRAVDRDANLSDEALAYALPAVPVTVQYELAGNVYKWSGTLSRSEGTGIDERTRTVPCRVRVENPRSVSMGGGSGALPVAGPRALTRGMFVTVNVHTEPAEPLLEVPEQAVRPGNRVWTVRDGKLQIAELPVAAIVGGKVLVPPAGAPLRPGDRVVTSPLPAATPGMSVRVAGDPVSPETDGVADAEAAADAAVDAAETDAAEVDSDVDFTPAVRPPGVAVQRGTNAAGAGG